MPPSIFRIFLLSLGVILGTLLFSCESPLSISGVSDDEEMEDLIYIDSVLNQVRELRYTDRALALTLAYDGLEQSQTEGLPEVENQFLGEIGCIFSEELDYDQAHHFYNEAISLARDRKDTAQEVLWLGEKGYSYLYTGHDSGAMRAFTEALLLAQQVQELSEEERIRLLVPANIDLAQLYATLLDYDQADVYLEEVRNLLAQSPDSTARARVYEAEAYRYLQEGMHQQNTGSLHKAIESYRNSNEWYLSIGSLASVPPNYLNMVAAYQHLASMDEAAHSMWLGQANLALEEFLHFTDAPQTAQYQVSGLHALASLQASQGEIEKARNTLNLILEKASEFHSQLDSAYAYWTLAELAEEAGELDSALYCMKVYEEISSRIRDIRSDKALRFAQAQFQTEKKDLENKQIRAESRQKLQLTLGSAVFIFLLLLGATAYYYQRQHHHRTMLVQQSQINRQTIIDLMKEQSIESLNARLEGQEKERKRIARELHDYLGGTLAAAKISLEGMKNDLSEKAQSSYHNTVTLLQNAYLETRQLSHDMMALPLKDLGLEASIKALCQAINQSRKLEVRFDSHAPHGFSLHTEKELHLYRILQELLQNVIKHARASHVTVQLTGDMEIVTLLVEDNGRGFPDSSSRSGMGLTSIQDRVKQLSGTLDIDSQPGKGSTIIIQFPHSS